LHITLILALSKYSWEFGTVYFKLLLLCIIVKYKCLSIIEKKKMIYIVIYPNKTVRKGNN